jgi:hypothetical protein
LRDGPGWPEYLIFNFGATARVTRVRIGTPLTLGKINYRVVSKVRIEAANNCDNFNVMFEAGIPFNNIIEFPNTVVASHIKIVIIGSDNGNMDASPIAINE